DHVDSIQFSHSSERFLSGSKDGTARIWYYQRSEWKSFVLNSQQQLAGSSPFRDEDTNKITKIRVTMVGWDLSDQFVITAINDHSVKVWESKTGKLIYVLKSHHDEIFIIEAHPTNPQLLLTAGHDGYIILWNLTVGKIVKKFYNSLEGQGHGAVFDCKFSPDGQRFATTDSHGHLAIYGFGSSEPYQKVPGEQFFHSDYRPVMRDINNHVLDEQTQTAPHLMPPPFLVDVDGNPHPVFYQRLIPGHSSNIRSRRHVVTSPPHVPASPMPPLLARIEEFERGAAFPDPEVLQSPPPGQNAPSLASPGVGSRNRGLLQDGDIEGVRQLNVNIPIIQDATEADTNAWRNRTIVPKLKESEAKWDEERRVLLGRQELLRYLREKKKRPLPSTSRSVSQTDKKAERFLRSRARAKNRRDRPRASEPRPVYNTRAAANTESDVEESGDEEVSILPSDSDDDDVPWHSSSSETSEYSDWTEEVGMNTRQQSESQRPSRRVRRVISSSDEEGETSTRPTKPVKKENDRPKKAPKKKKKKVGD
ncbi:PH-interacting -like, partial [Paramuricea clavata]